MYTPTGGYISRRAGKGTRRLRVGDSRKSEFAEAAEYAFHEAEVRDVAFGHGGRVHVEQAVFGHVAEQHLGHAEREVEQGGDLGDGTGALAEAQHVLVLGLDRARVQLL